jgi:hypothetical protein
VRVGVLEICSTLVENVIRLTKLGARKPDIENADDARRASHGVPFQLRKRV